MFNCLLLLSVTSAKMITLSVQSLEDSNERKLQDDARELEQQLSRRNILLAKQEEYSKKIRELGPLSSDAFDTYSLFDFYVCSFIACDS